MLFLDGEGKEGGKEGQGRRERRGSVRSFVRRWIDLQTEGGGGGGVRSGSGVEEEEKSRRIGRLRSLGGGKR